MKKQSKKYKVSYQKIICTILIILGSIVGIFIVFGNKPTLSHAETSYKTHKVSYGETLWEIASIETKNNSYYSKKDIRYVINHIKTINNLKTSTLYIEQELLIPQI